MNKQSTTFAAHSASSSSVFAGAELAEDYDEEVVTKTTGNKPRRSESAQDLTEVASSSSESRKSESSPEGENEPLRSSLFAGGTQSLLGARSGAAALAKDGARGFFNRFGLHLAPGPEEAAAIEEQHRIEDARTQIRQATWTRAASVLIANPKGGTGKTPLALLLGGTLASIRGGSVAVIEVADDPGALAYRAEGNPRLGVGDLVRDADHIRTAGQLAGYTAPQTSFAAMVKVIDDYYAIRVMDSGNQPTSSAFQGALFATDVLVVPIVNAGDSTLEAIRMLDGMRASGGRAKALAERAIIARVTDGRPENAAVSAEVERIITAAGVGTLCDLPYDPHIAERGQITLAKLAPTTIAAFTHLANAVIQSLNTTVTPDLEEVS
jgi:MinD-like ATPase involved in chromosome partitioning or flagellar assembly